jgi:hypothetical protein
MSKKQGPQTFEKRLRERKKQLKRAAKFAKRNERNAKKRDDKLDPEAAHKVDEAPDPRAPENQPPSHEDR